MIEIKVEEVFDDGKSKGNMYYAISKYEDKEILKGAGMRWNPDKKRWETTAWKVVAKLKGNPDVSTDMQTDNQIKADKELMEAKMQESQSVHSDILLPTPDGLSMRDYQKAAVEFIANRSHALIADEMGLGKTIEAIGYINYAHPSNVLIVAPKAAADLVWIAELQKWLVGNYTINRVCDINTIGNENTIDIIHYEQLLKIGSVAQGNNRLVVNFMPGMESKKWDLMVFDESHMLKSRSAKRTKIALKLAEHGNKRVLLTGTPIMNRPYELFSQLRMLNSPLAKSWYVFSNSYIITNEWGTPIDSKNLNVLQERLRSSVMLRRAKKDVLKELPDKIRQTIILPDSILSKDLKEREKDTIQKYKDIIMSRGDSTLALPGMEKVAILFEEMAKIRHETALQKLPIVIEHVKELIEAGEKVVVWVHHRDVAEKLLKEFGDIAVKYTGQENDAERKEAYESFQNNEKIRIFIGSMKAAGVGLTLTEANVCVFAELDWVPATITQAEDRLYRMGQKKVVQSQYLVVKDTIDSLIAEKLTEKSEVIHKVVDYNALNGEKGEGSPVSA